MEELREAIITDGIAIGNDTLKIDSFLNHRIDVELVTKIGEAFHNAFANEKVDLILTVESSGIAAALTTAQAFGNVPVVYAKKGVASTMGGDVLSAQVYSFTHQSMNTIHVARPYLPESSHVLIIDDFLANGEAVEGLLSILRQARCYCSGAGICVEKGFQPGGKQLRAQGIKVVSLAIVDSIHDGQVTLRPEEEIMDE